jgi:hypothetical protein
MYTPKIYVVEWFKNRHDSIPHFFLLCYTRFISQIFITFLLLTHPPKEVCCGLNPLMNQGGAPALVQTPAASSWPTPFLTVPSTLRKRKVFIYISWSSRSSFVVLSPSKGGGVLRATPPYEPGVCTHAGPNTSRVFVANAISDSS